MSLPEWTFGEAEPSSHGNTRSTPCDAACTTIPSRLTAIYVAQVAASREVLLGKQDLLSRTRQLEFGADGKFGTVDDPVGWPHLADPNAPPASGLPFTEQSQYDIKGRQTLHVSFEGVVTRFHYDDTPHGNGRIIEKQFFDNLTQYNGRIFVDLA